MLIGRLEDACHRAHGWRQREGQQGASAGSETRRFPEVRFLVRRWAGVIRSAENQKSQGFKP